MDLRPLEKVTDYAKLINDAAFGIRIEHDHDLDRTTAALVGIPSRKSLPVWSLEKLGDHTVERLKVKF